MMSPTDRAIMELGRKGGNTQRVLPPAPGTPTMFDTSFRQNEMLRQMEMDRRKQEMENTGGFDASDLMAKPEIRQEETRNQADMVSAPYEDAKFMSAMKTNPMNAASQNPGKPFLMRFIGK